MMGGRSKSLSFGGVGGGGGGERRIAVGLVMLAESFRHPLLGGATETRKAALPVAS